jgi:hypothetical protein
MIITVAKPFERLLKSLAAYRRVFIVGCAACATKCKTGGEEAAAAMAEELRMAGKEVNGSCILDTPCDIRIARRDVGHSEEALSADALLVLACGAGVQSVEKVTGKPLIPGLDPVFTGTTERIGVYHEFCSVCGDCLLEKTGGICPVARCAKGLVNGPCGGTVDGKCEADLGRDCAWALIFDKLKRQGREKELLDFQPPRATAKPKQISPKAKTP